MRFILGVTVTLTALAIARTRAYKSWVRWIWLRDVRISHPHLYGRGR